MTSEKNEEILRKEELKIQKKCIKRRKKIAYPVVYMAQTDVQVDTGKILRRITVRKGSEVEAPGRARRKATAISSVVIMFEEQDLTEIGGGGKLGATWYTLWSSLMAKNSRPHAVSPSIVDRRGQVAEGPLHAPSHGLDGRIMHNKTQGYITQFFGSMERSEEQSWTLCRQSKGYYYYFLALFPFSLSTFFLLSISFSPHRGSGLVVWGKKKSWEDVVLNFPAQSSHWILKELTLPTHRITRSTDDLGLKLVKILVMSGFNSNCTMGIIFTEAGIPLGSASVKIFTCYWGTCGRARNEYMHLSGARAVGEKGKNEGCMLFSEENKVDYTVSKAEKHSPRTHSSVDDPKRDMSQTLMKNTWMNFNGIDRRNSLNNMNEASMLNFHQLKPSTVLHQCMIVPIIPGQKNTFETRNTPYRVFSSILSAMCMKLGVSNGCVKYYHCAESYLKQKLLSATWYNYILVKLWSPYGLNYRRLKKSSWQALELIGYLSEVETRIPVVKRLVMGRWKHYSKSRRREFTLCTNRRPPFML
ncbi:hypothetical protein VP01_751g2 [Puccinia sorghi]|uniref:Uncharacterized protein n=1 Tax=Puccinia sorghi TaxID=27349 RepID=A0A0L6UC75_9BASI|nr:hypothetical protein VP01_751g2 [Puccinia sorghi]